MPIVVDESQMRQKLSAWLGYIIAKFRSLRWWLGAGLAAAWWLADARYELADEANDGLDRWAFPVLPEASQFVVNTLLAPAAVIVGFVVLLIGHAYYESRRDTKGSSFSSSLAPSGELTNRVIRAGSQEAVELQRRRLEEATREMEQARTEMERHSGPVVHSLTVAPSDLADQPLRGALQEMLTKGVSLKARTADSGTAITLMARGMKPATEPEIDHWEVEVQTFLKGRPLLAAQFMADSPEIWPVQFSMNPLGDRLDHRLKCLEQIIKEL